MRFDISLEEIMDHAIDLVWIETHAGAIATELEAGVKDDQRQDESIEVLLKIFPQLFHSAHIRRWSRLADQAVRYVVESPVVNYPETNQPEYLIGNRFVLKRLDHERTARRAEPGRKIRIRINPRRFLEQYLLLALTQHFKGVLQIDERQINDVLSMAQLVNHPVSHFKVYQIVALMFCSLGQAAQAQHFAALSFNYYESQRNTLESAISAQLLAAALSKQGEQEKAERYHDTARAYIAQTPYPHILDLMLSGI